MSGVKAKHTVREYSVPALKLRGKLPWVAVDLSGACLCEGFSYGKRRPCKRKAKYVYVLNNGTVRRLCLSHFSIELDEELNYTDAGPERTKIANMIVAGKW